MVKRNKRNIVESAQERSKNTDKRDGRLAFQKSPGIRLPIKGLHNLGNTCFLNSVIQCLSQTPHLYEFLALPLCQKASLKRPDGNGIATLQIELTPKELPAAVQLSDLASRLRCKHNDIGVTSPRALREFVIQRHPRFSGFGQHDCHEFLRALMDCLRQEELMIWRKGILDKFQVTENVSEEERQLIRSWGRAASFATRVDRLFGGIIVSSLKCDVCQTVRTNFEYFLDLSLPIPDGKGPLGGGAGGEGRQASARDSTTRYSAAGEVRKSKQELKRERRKKPQKSKRKHERARKREQFLDELADECSSEFAPPVNGEDHKITEAPLKPSPDGEEFVSLSDAEAEPSTRPTTTNEEAAAATVHQDHQDTDTGGVVNQTESDEITTTCNDNDKADHVDASPSAANQTDTFSEPPSNSPGRSEPKAAENSELLDQEISQPASVTQDSGSSDGGCADVEDSDGNDRHPHPCTTTPCNPPQVETSPEQLVQAGSADAMPAFLEEQLRQLDLNEEEGKSDDSESLLIQASRLAQIPLQTSTLGHQHMPGPRKKSGASVCDLYSCLSLFTAPEHLDGCNRIVCPECNGFTEAADGKPTAAGDTALNKGREPMRTEAVRRDLILQPPPLLTIHLKRFQQIGVHLQKSQKTVLFPIDLDLSPFCSVLYLSASRSIHYRLYGVVEHLGRMAGGHYVAYVAVPTPGNSEDSTCRGCPAHEDGRARNEAMLDFVKRFVGPLESPPKWPMTTHDLVRRWRRCDRNRLSESIEEAQSLVHEMRACSPDPVPCEPYTTRSDLNDSQALKSMTDSRTWFRCSDEHITKVTLDTVLSCQAYVLFYERVK